MIKHQLNRLRKKCRHVCCRGIKLFNFKSKHKLNHGLLQADNADQGICNNMKVIYIKNMKQKCNVKNNHTLISIVLLQADTKPYKIIVIDMIWKAAEINNWIEYRRIKADTRVMH